MPRAGTALPYRFFWLPLAAEPPPTFPEPTDGFAGTRRTCRGYRGGNPAGHSRRWPCRSSAGLPLVGSPGSDHLADGLRCPSGRFRRHHRRLQRPHRRAPGGLYRGSSGPPSFNSSIAAHKRRPLLPPVRRSRLRILRRFPVAYEDINTPTSAAEAINAPFLPDNQPRPTAEWIYGTLLLHGLDEIHLA
ncbi:hypothetical protein KSP39_PZI024450 [Platanthera zijinensis]|uniref:Uncharacterized protein n=1 Tax=Platanthera zijinensis TaxID=2320716 RepID=A0AAP0FTS0_9ASPA